MTLDASQQLEQQPQQLQPTGPQLKVPQPKLVSKTSCTGLSERDLHTLFQALDTNQDGIIGLEEIKETITYLEKVGPYDITAKDSHQLSKYLSVQTPSRLTAASCSACVGISGAQFVLGIQTLTETLSRLKTCGITLRQMKIVLTAAFERFDTNGDGEISQDEFLAAAQYMGMNISLGDISVLYSFLRPSKEDVLNLESLISVRSFQEKWTEALGRSLEQMRKRKGIDGVAALMSRMQTEFAAGGALKKRLERVWNIAVDGIDDACNFAEVGVDMAGVAVSLKYIADIMDNMYQSHASQPLDVETLLPLLTFSGLGLVNTLKELNEIVPQEMSEDEAQLYGQIFDSHGFSQAQTRRLLSCPGFSWVSVEAGEELPDDGRLRILLRGSAEVKRTGPSGLEGAVVIPAGSILGDVSFLHQRCLWSQETVKAREQMFCASWDHAELRQTLKTDAETSLLFDSLLTESMIANVHAKVKLDRGRTPTSCSQTSSNPKLALDLLELMDVDGDGFVTKQEFEAVSGSELFAQVLLAAKSNGDNGDNITRHTMEMIMPSILEMLHLDESSQSRSRMFAYFDTNGDGVISVSEFQSKLSTINECTSSMTGLSMKELESVMYRAFSKFDVNGDGVINEEEFMAVAEKLHLPLKGEQMKMLFEYFDTDKDGSIDYSEWQAGAGCQVSLADALRDSLHEQAERKGLTQVKELMDELGLIFLNPGELVPKVRRAAAKVADSSDALAELLNATSDFSGMGVALFGMWTELSGVNSGELSDVDWLPFAVFFSILGVSAVRRLAEGQVTDLSEEEALLYATGFESNGFTVTEFRKLLRYGNARWTHLDTGDVVSSAEDPSLKIISLGTCEVSYDGSQSLALAGRGQILGASDFFYMDMEHVARAKEAATVVSLDGEALRQSLAHDDSLSRRFNRVASKSMIEGFLKREVPI